MGLPSTLEDILERYHDGQLGGGTSTAGELRADLREVCIALCQSRNENLRLSNDLSDALEALKNRPRELVLLEQQVAEQQAELCASYEECRKANEAHQEARANLQRHRGERSELVRARAANSRLKKERDSLIDENQNLRKLVMSKLAD